MSHDWDTYVGGMIKLIHVWLSLMRKERKPGSKLSYRRSLLNGEFSQEDRRSLDLVIKTHRRQVETQRDPIILLQD
jgi:hypothetical protein